MPFKITPPLYSIWQGMKHRCDNSRFRMYKDYGGRGIKVCDSWINNYAAFERDMSPRPPGMTIERIDNNGHYSPENCRWATRKEQTRNQRTNRYVVVEGVRYLAVELAEQAGVKTDTIVDRAARGLPLALVLSPDFLPNRRKPVEALAAKKQKQLARTHCSEGHEFTPDNLRYTPQGWYRCRICHNAKARKRTAAI